MARASGAALAARVALLALTVGLIVRIVAQLSAAGGCRGGTADAGVEDVTCAQLVHTLSGRMGVAAAVATAVVVLTMVGLARTGGRRGPSARREPRG